MDWLILSDFNVSRLNSPRTFIFYRENGSSSHRYIGRCDPCTQRSGFRQALYYLGIGLLAALQQAVILAHQTQKVRRTGLLQVELNHAGRATSTRKSRLQDFNDKTVFCKSCNFMLCDNPPISKKTMPTL